LRRLAACVQRTFSLGGGHSVLCKSRSNNPSLKRPMCSVAPD
jgi:hypothetical protein